MAIMCPASGAQGNHASLGEEFELDGLQDSAGAAEKI